MKEGIARVALALLAGALFFGPSAAQAGSQLFEASWTVKAMGNERSGGTGASAVYSAFGIPQGIQCNPNQPRCPFESTPTDGIGNFSRLGGSPSMGLYCAPWFDWQGGGATARPAKGGTVTTGPGRLRIPPLYRNTAFFTPNGQPGTTSCTATSRTVLGGPGAVMLGNPIAGTWSAVTTGTQRGGFNFATAPAIHKAGLRTTGLAGSFGSLNPPVASYSPPRYRYTYATVRNAKGAFGPGIGPGNFTLKYNVESAPVATIKVRQGPARFGGTMRLLGALTTKGCNRGIGLNRGCWFGSNNWRYDAIGTSASTYGGVVSQGYIVTNFAYYSRSDLGQISTVSVSGARFPWTTGSVSVKATGREHKTVHYAHGYDNRNTNTPSGLGTIQLVTPVLTRWRSRYVNFETGGIGILRIKFLPEPQMWVTLVAGVSLLGVAWRLRGS